MTAEEIKSAIEAANAKFCAGVAKADGAAIAALFAPDGQTMPAGSAPIQGGEANRQFWQNVCDSGVAAASLTTSEIHGEAPTVTEVGAYELRDDAGNALDHGKYIVVWQHSDGTWKLLRDMFSTNVPPSAD